MKRICIHKMGLYERPFQAIKSGRKIIEIRLNDDKRRKVKHGDIIEFTKVPEQNEKLKAEVLELKKYDSFKQMYEDIPAKDLDAEEQSINEMVENTYKIYTQEQEKEWGTLAIRIRLIG